jgi:hypothetical protein
MTEKKIARPVRLQVLPMLGFHASPTDELLFQITTNRCCGRRLKHNQ